MDNKTRSGGTEEHYTSIYYALHSNNHLCTKTYSIIITVYKNPRLKSKGTAEAKHILLAYVAKWSQTQSHSDDLYHLDRRLS